jgi:hypothetical protein
MLQGKKVLSIILELVTLSILTVVAYFGAMRLLCVFGYGPFPGIFLISVIVFDVIYVSTIKFWPLKNIHIKIIVALLLVAFSAALATIYIACYMLRDFHW